MSNQTSHLKAIFKALRVRDIRAVVFTDKIQLDFKCVIDGVNTRKVVDLSVDEYKLLQVSLGNKYNIKLEEG